MGITLGHEGNTLISIDPHGSLSLGCDQLPIRVPQVPLDPGIWNAWYPQVS